MISHAIDGSLVVIRADGKYTSDDIRATFNAALSDPKLPPKARLLIDARESLANPTINEMEARLAMLEEPSASSVRTVLRHRGDDAASLGSRADVPGRF